MLAVKEAGATVLFLAPGFYHGAETIDDLVNFIAARALDHLGLELELAKRWGGDERQLRVRPAGAGRSPAHVRPHRPGLRRDEPDDDRRSRPALAPVDRGGGCSPGDIVSSTPAAAPATSRSRPRGPADRHRARLLGADARARAAEGARARPGSEVDLLELPFEDASFDAATVGFGVRNVDDLAARARRAAPRPSSRRPARHPRDHAAARRRFAPFYRFWFDRVVPLLGKLLDRWLRVHVSARQRAPLPGPSELAELIAAAGFARRLVPPLRRRIVALHTARGRLSALAEIREAPGLDAYLGELEERLEQAVARPPRRRRRSRATRSRPAASGCGRCSSIPRRRPARAPPVAAGVAVELVHLATLVTTT